MKSKLRKLFWRLPLPHAGIVRLVGKTKEISRMVRRRYRLLTGAYAHVPALDITSVNQQPAQSQALVFDWSTPRPDVDSGSIDTFNYIRMFQALGFHVTFVPHDLEYADNYTQELQRIGVKCLYGPYVESIDAWLKRVGPAFDVVMVQRAHFAIQHIGKIRRHCTKAKVLFNTVDLHFVREQREAALLGSRSLARQAVATKEVERTLMHQADATIVISAQEQEAVKKEWPKVNVVAIPFIREVQPSRVPFEERKDIFFLGGFSHMPNVDAVEYFMTDIWRLVKARIPDIRFYIVGSSMPKKFDELKAAPDVVPLGYLEDLSPILDKCRLSIAPLRFGAGIKGKIGTSLSHGIPCIATPLAAEGMGLTDDVNIRIGTDAASFANALIELYQDKAKWEAISNNGVDHFARAYSFESALGRLRELLLRLREPEKGGQTTF